MSAFARRQPVSPERALERLEDLCARAETSSGEARAKLRTWGVPSTEAEKILTSLIQRRYIDDARFAGAYVRDKYRYSRWGRRKIALSLRAKGIDDDTIAGALDTIDPDEYAAALRSVIMAKIRVAGIPQDYDARMRLLRAAVARGYEYDLAKKVLQTLTRP